MSDAVSKRRWARGLLLELGLTLGLVLGCPAAPPLPPADPPDAAPRAALQGFLEAQKAGDFDKAYALLAAKLRAVYTPEHLRGDYVRDRDLADDKLARIRAALAAGTPLQLHGDEAELPLGPNLATRLVREDGAWHVAAIE